MYMYIYSRAQENIKTASKGHTKKKNHRLYNIQGHNSHMHTQHTRIFRGISSMRHKECAIKTLCTQGHSSVLTVLFAVRWSTSEELCVAFFPQWVAYWALRLQLRLQFLHALLQLMPPVKTGFCTK